MKIVSLLIAIALLFVTSETQTATGFGIGVGTARAPVQTLLPAFSPVPIMPAYVPTYAPPLYTPAPIMPAYMPLYAAPPTATGFGLGFGQARTPWVGY